MVNIDKKVNPKSFSRSLQIFEPLSSSFNDEDESDSSLEKTLMDCNSIYRHFLHLKQEFNNICLKNKKHHIWWELVHYGTNSKLINKNKPKKIWYPPQE